MQNTSGAKRVETAPLRFHQACNVWQIVVIGIEVFGLIVKNIYFVYYCRPFVSDVATAFVTRNVS